MSSRAKRLEGACTVRPRQRRRDVHAHKLTRPMRLASEARVAYVVTTMSKSVASLQGRVHIAIQTQ